MSIRGYKKKTKPALWKQMADQAEKAVDKYLKRHPQRNRQSENRRRLYSRHATRFIEEARRNGVQCPVTGGEVNQIHHRNGRLGSLLMDKRFWIPVSREGHRKIHDAPDWARANGLLAHIGEWNMPAPV